MEDRKRRWGWLRFWGEEQQLFFGPTFGCCARREKRGTEQTRMASAGVNGKGNFIIKAELEIRTRLGGTSMGSDGLRTGTTRNVDGGGEEGRRGKETMGVNMNGGWGWAVRSGHGRPRSERKDELGMNGNGSRSRRKGKGKGKGMGNGNGNTMEIVDYRRESARCRPQPKGKKGTAGAAGNGSGGSNGRGGNTKTKK
ncbi:hypothetical protein LZ32DRAFT_158267 [Colletotrichum eremochloae]|nr:hypothetical protein LZ32DRAFT_158267 [Colletotrichum eremochloae]